MKKSDRKGDWFTNKIVILIIKDSRFFSLLFNHLNGLKLILKTFFGLFQQFKSQFLRNILIFLELCKLWMG
jgi:TRAP-type mannitol/chloroaromatic compound transport system permease large subunit